MRRVDAVVGEGREKDRRLLPLEPDEPLPEEPLSLLPDASPDVEALLSPVALPLLSAEPLLVPLLPEEVALPPWVLETMNAAPSSVSPLLHHSKVSREFFERGD